MPANDSNDNLVSAVEAELSFLTHERVGIYISTLKEVNLCFVVVGGNMLNILSHTYIRKCVILDVCQLLYHQQRSLSKPTNIVKSATVTFH